MRGCPASDPAQLPADAAFIEPTVRIDPTVRGPPNQAMMPAIIER
jgi:hypothetical protein